MAVNATYQNEIDEVDNTKILTFVTNTTTYAENEWSYNGLEITGYDDFAKEQGAAALLYAMGFRHYGPTEKYIKRPVSIPTNLTAAKQSDWMPYNRVFLAYGYDKQDVVVQAQQNADHLRWQLMNNVYYDRLPAGHRWSSIIQSAAGLAYFGANPNMILNGDPNVASPYFNLNCTGSDYDNMVEFCAGFMLDAGLNSSNKTNFDPTDTSPWNSEQVGAFTKAVVDRMRAGTNAIGTLDAQAGVANAQLGIYAYFNHAPFPTTITDLSGVYVQVATSYNYSGYTVLELITGWGALVDFLAIREYFDVEQWSFSIPRKNVKNVRGSMAYLAGYRAGGCRGFNAEFQANWLANMVAMYRTIRIGKTGANVTTTHDSVLEDIVTDIFDGDAAVQSLLEQWSLAYITPNLFTLKQWCDTIDTMVDSWYKTDFEQYMVILYEYLTLPANTAAGFRDAASTLFSHVQAVTADNWMHSYAFLRRTAIAQALGAHTDLAWNASPRPAWFTAPTAPTHTDYTTMTAVLDDIASRPIELDSGDLVMVELTPEYTGSNPDNKILVGGTSTFCFVGPGTAVWTPDSGAVQEIDFGPGTHLLTRTFTGAGKAHATNGGKIFLYAFPIVSFPYYVPATQGYVDLYMYVPESVGGSVLIDSLTKLSVYWNGGSLTITSSTDGAGQSVIPAGQLRIFMGEPGTRGACTFGNVNPWLSPYPDFALMSRELAELDFPARTKIGVPVFVGSDDTADPETDETGELIDGE